MSSLYPSIESLTVDAMRAAQVDTALRAQQALQQGVSAQPSYAPGTAPVASASNALSLYGALYSDLGLDEYMGLSLAMQERQLQVSAGSSSRVLANALPSEERGLRKAEVTNGVRPIILCKGSDGKMGVSVRSVNKGVFVSCVWKGSPAAMAGLRVGDQILQIDGENLAGYSSDKALKRLKACNPERAMLIIRDRPFERTITLSKDSHGHCGFVFHNGVINSIVKDSSAARNGLTTEHNILEVDGQNVIGLNDKDLLAVIQRAGQSVTYTIMPSVIYKEMEKNLSSSMKKNMDHSERPEW